MHNSLLSMEMIEQSERQYVMLYTYKIDLQWEYIYNLENNH